MALLPGDKPDEELRALSTVADALRRAIWSKVGPKFDEFLDLCKGHVGWRRSAGIRAAIAEGEVCGAGISDLATARRGGRMAPCRADYILSCFGAG
jgi:cobaltochelatase CobN